jgi:hypothetical protein
MASRLRTFIFSGRFDGENSYSAFLGILDDCHFPSFRQSASLVYDVLTATGNDCLTRVGAVLARSAAKASAAAFPMHCPPPVTIAVFFVNRMDGCLAILVKEHQGIQS